jgi:hypothetical protein
MNQNGLKVIFKSAIFFLPIMFIFFAYNGAVFAQEWVWNEYDPIEYQLDDIIYENGLFVAVGYNGTILTSEDTADWNTIDPIPSTWLRSISYGIEKFYAVAIYGNIISSSSNGQDWSTIPAGISGGLNSIIYNAGRFVAVGRYWDSTAGWYKGLIALSDDGVYWTEQKLSKFGQLNGITYGDGLYVTVGYDNSGSTIVPVIATSQNGIDWDKQNFVPASGVLLENVGYCNGNFLIVGGLGNKILLSPDGFSWQEIATGNMYGTWEGITCADGLYVIAGPRILSSPDGQTWTIRKDNSGAKGITYGDGYIVAVGYLDGSRIAVSNISCALLEGNSDGDCDVDGLDLAAFAVGPFDENALAAIASEFGNIIE